MKTNVLKLAVALCLLLTLPLIPNAQIVLATEEASINRNLPHNRAGIIFKIKHESLVNKTSEESFIKEAKKLFSLSVNNFPGLENYYFLNPQSGKENETLLKLRQSSKIEFAEWDNYYLPQMIPNDPYYNKQWYFSNFFSMQGIWNTKFSDSKNVLAVIDSGIDYNHEDLKKILWKNPREIPGNGVDDDQNGYIDDISGVNVVNRSSELYDDCGHGTIVSSIAGAALNNHKGISGILGQTGKILAIKANVANTCFYNYSDIAKALAYAADIPEVKVINISLGGSADSITVRDVIRQILDQNKIVIVAGAGNDGSDLMDNPFYPSSYKGVVSVGSYKKDGYRYKYNYGYKLDVLAPGKNVWSAFSGGGYGAVSGTSVSTPFVSALSLLLADKFLDYSSLEIQQILRNWSDCPKDLATCGRDGWDKFYGYGRLNPQDSFVNKCPDTGRIKSSVYIGTPDDRAIYKKGSLLNILGTAKSNRFTSYSLSWSNDKDYSKWSTSGISLANNGSKQMEDGVLGQLDTSILPGEGFYLLKLSVLGDASCLKNKVGEDRSGFFLSL